MKRLTLVLASLAAWLPTLHAYIPVNDDYVFQKLSLSAYYNIYGFWRILGQPLFAHAAWPVLILILHIATVLIVYEAAKAFVGESALVVGLVTATAPFAYQVIAWAAAATYILATLFFWLNLYLLTSERKESRVYVLSFLCALLSLLSNECLLGACFISGVVCWPNWKRAIPPVVGAIAYLILYKIHPQPLKVVSFHWQSGLSPWAYQYKNLVMFGAWKHGTLIKTLFSQIGILHIIGLAALTGSIWFLFKSDYRSEKTTPIAPVLILMLGASSIYALTGFSLDSRKQYPFMPLLLLFLVMLWQRTKHEIPKLLMIAFIVCFTFQSWMMAALWRYEAERGFSIYEGGESAPALYDEWRYLETSFGGRLDNREFLEEVRR
jgi:hypothetical protein